MKDNRSKEVGRQKDRKSERRGQTVIGWMMCFIALMACNQRSEVSNQIQKRIVPQAGAPRCEYTGKDAYNLSVGSYVGAKGIKYFVKNYPDGVKDTAYYDDVIHRAWDAWKEHIGKLSIERTMDPVGDEENGYKIIEIKFDKLDGSGGVLGQADYPPADASDDHKRTVVFDSWDMIGQEEGTAVFDFFTIAVHEFGHSLGVKHCDSKFAVMYYVYISKVKGLSIDDICGIREKYNHDAFDLYGDHYHYLCSDINGSPNKYFSYKEFYTKCNIDGGHYLDERLMNAIYELRKYYKIPIKILSSYRTPECNHVAGGASMSRHMYFDAIDWKFTGKYARTMHRRYIDDVKNKGIAFHILFDAGIRGFGAYPTSCHIDTRDNANMWSWHGEYYNTWGKMNENAYLAPDYYGVESCE